MTFLYFAAPLAARTGGDVLKEVSNEAVADAASQAVAPATQILPLTHILGITVFTAIFGISLGYLIAKKMSPVSLD